MMLDLLAYLHSLRARPVEIDRAHLAGKLASAIRSMDWLALVSADGLIVASCGPTLASPAIVAVEHFWVARDGQGMALKAAYEGWARSKGCVAIHIGGAPGDKMGALARHGYVAAETSWVLNASL